MALAHEEITSAIIGAAIEVHRTLGPGFLEKIYEMALVVELTRREIPFQRQFRLPVIYKEVRVGRHQLDFIVQDTIVVELKAVKEIKDVHFAIVRSYLRALDKEHALILNFSKLTLEVKRVIARA